MSNILYNDFPDFLPMNMDTKDFPGNLGMLQYVNPQDTDKQYRGFQDSHPSTFSNGLMTPPQTILDPSSRRPSLMIASTPASCNGGPESASSTSSFESSPGCPSSCPSSASTAPSSRRQSVVYSDTQQPYKYSSGASPSPLFRCGPHKETLNLNQQLVHGSYSTDELGIISNTIPYTVLGDVATNDFDDDPFEGADSRLAWTDRDAVAYGMPGQRTLSMDLSSGFNGSLAPARPVEYLQPNLKALRPDNLPRCFSQDAMVSQSAVTLSPSTLGPNWQHQAGGHEQDISYSDDDSQPTIFEKGGRRKQKLRLRQNIVGGSVKSRCEFCIPPAKYECNRPEHLRRHKATKHPDESGEKQEKYVCNFPDCIDKKTGKVKVIIARGDNYKAHYNKTHFSYGNTEKSGKNTRKSMKMSIEKNLRSTDNRWTMMLAGKMKVGDDAKDDTKPGQQKFPSVWKMIGYSIKETRQIKVKDIAPDWQGPDDTMLEKFDCRWKALKNGELTYEQAMSVGTDMLETPRQGLLGVDMFESEEMGLEFHDPRWQMLRSGRMNAEDAEKLGVIELTSQARRKR